MKKAPKKPRKTAGIKAEGIWRGITMKDAVTGNRHHETEQSREVHGYKKVA